MASQVAASARRAASSAGDPVDTSFLYFSPNISISARSSFALRAVESASTAASGVAKVRCSAAASASGRARSKAGRARRSPAFKDAKGFMVVVTW